MALLSFAAGICSPGYLWDDKHGLSEGKKKLTPCAFFFLEESSDLTSDLPLHDRPELEPKPKHREI